MNPEFPVPTVPLPIPSPTQYPGQLHVPRPPVSTPPRPATPNPAFPIPIHLHDPYGPGLSFAEFKDVVLETLMINESFTSPQDQEAGKSHTIATRTRGWREVIFTPIRPIFSCIQMRLPSMYYLRVEEIIRESDISVEDFASIQRRALLGMIALVGGVSVTNISEIHSMKRFKKKWRAFVTRCMKEWRFLNVISTLLMSILLTFLQIPEAGYHPVTRLAALLSLVCAFMSLLYCTLYLARFHSLKGVERGMSWIFAATEPSTPPYWNLWLFLALPAVWLAWSLIFFSAGLLSFIWTSGDRRVPALTPFTNETNDGTMDYLPMSLNHFTPLGSRVILTAAFTLGIGMCLLDLKAFRDVSANTYDKLTTKRCRSDSISSKDSE